MVDKNGIKVADKMDKICVRHFQITVKAVLIFIGSQKTVYRIVFHYIVRNALFVTDTAVMFIQTFVN